MFVDKQNLGHAFLLSHRILLVSPIKMSSERLENLEDGLTRLLDELKTSIYHQLPELRGGHLS